MKIWDMLTVLIPALFIEVQVEGTVIAETTSIEVVPLQFEEFKEFDLPVLAIHADLYQPENITYITTRHHVYRVNIFSGETEIVGNQRYESLGDIVQLNSSSFIVSDLYNHCLHIIQDGQASKYAGTCQHDLTPMYDYDGFDEPYGTIEGNRLEVNLVAPSGLTLAKNNIYVSQSGAGLIITRIHLETDQAFLVLKDILFLPLWTRYYTTFNAATNTLYSITDKGLLRYNVESGNHSVTTLDNFKWDNELVYHTHMVNGRMMVDDEYNLYSLDVAGNRTNAHSVKQIHGTVLLQSDKLISIESQNLIVSSVAFKNHTTSEDNSKPSYNTSRWIPVYVFAVFAVLMIIIVITVKCTRKTPRKQGFKNLQKMSRMGRSREDKNELLDSDEEFSNSI